MHCFSWFPPHLLHLLIARFDVQTYAFLAQTLLEKYTGTLWRFIPLFLIVVSMYADVLGKVADIFPIILHITPSLLRVMFISDDVPLKKEVQTPLLGGSTSQRSSMCLLTPSRGSGMSRRRDRVKPRTAFITEHFVWFVLMCIVLDSSVVRWLYVVLFLTCILNYAAKKPRLSFVLVAVYTAVSQIWFPSYGPWERPIDSLFHSTYLYYTYMIYSVAFSATLLANDARIFHSWRRSMVCKVLALPSQVEKRIPSDIVATVSTLTQRVQDYFYFLGFDLVLNLYLWLSLTMCEWYLGVSCAGIICTFFAIVAVLGELFEKRRREAFQDCLALLFVYLAFSLAVYNFAPENSFPLLESAMVSAKVAQDIVSQSPRRVWTPWPVLALWFAMVYVDLRWRPHGAVVIEDSACWYNQALCTNAIVVCSFVVYSAYRRFRESEQVIDSPLTMVSTPLCITHPLQSPLKSDRRQREKSLRNSPMVLRESVCLPSCATCIFSKASKYAFFPGCGTLAATSGHDKSVKSVCGSSATSVDSNYNLITAGDDAPDCAHRRATLECTGNKTTRPAAKSSSILYESGDWATGEEPVLEVDPVLILEEEECKNGERYDMVRGVEEEDTEKGVEEEEGISAAMVEEKEEDEEVVGEEEEEEQEEEEQEQEEEEGEGENDSPCTEGAAAEKAGVSVVGGEERTLAAPLEGKAFAEPEREALEVQSPEVCEKVEHVTVAVDGQNGVAYPENGATEDRKEQVEKFSLPPPSHAAQVHSGSDSKEFSQSLPSRGSSSVQGVSVASVGGRKVVARIVSTADKVVKRSTFSSERVPVGANVKGSQQSQQPPKLANAKKEVPIPLPRGMREKAQTSILEKLTTVATDTRKKSTGGSGPVHSRDVGETSSEARNQKATVIAGGVPNATRPQIKGEARSQRPAEDVLAKMHSSKECPREEHKLIAPEGSDKGVSVVKLLHGIAKECKISVPDPQNKTPAANSEGGTKGTAAASKRNSKSDGANDGSGSGGLTIPQPRSRNMVALPLQPQAKEAKNEVEMSLSQMTDVPTMAESGKTNDVPLFDVSVLRKMVSEKDTASLLTEPVRTIPDDARSALENFAKVWVPCAKPAQADGSSTSEYEAIAAAVANKVPASELGDKAALGPVDTFAPGTNTSADGGCAPEASSTSAAAGMMQLYGMEQHPAPLPHYPVQQHVPMMMMPMGDGLMALYPCVSSYPMQAPVAMQALPVKMPLYPNTLPQQQMVMYPNLGAPMSQPPGGQW